MRQVPVLDGIEKREESDSSSLEWRRRIKTKEGRFRSILISLMLEKQTSHYDLFVMVVGEGSYYSAGNYRRKNDVILLTRVKKLEEKKISSVSSLKESLPNVWKWLKSDKKEVILKE